MLATLDAGGLVVVTGVGKNLHIAEKMSAIFASTGTRPFLRCCSLNVFNTFWHTSIHRSSKMLASPVTFQY